MENSIDIEINSESIDEMNEKLEAAKNNAEDLAEALDLPSLTIKLCKNCTFNINFENRR